MGISFHPYKSITITLMTMLIIFTIMPLHTAVPPPDPVECKGGACEVRNAYGAWGDRKKCFASAITYPTTEEELRLAVANATLKNFKVKVVTKFSHTIPKLACPTSQTNTTTLLISTSLYNSAIQLDPLNRRVTVDGGVALRDLINAVELAGLSLVAAPYWEGVTIGGLISTGSHGSSWWGKGGAVHDHVVGIDLVVPATAAEGYAKIVRLEGQDPLLRAAKVSLGVLGVISKVKLALEPAFKRSITYNFTSDEGIQDNFVDHAKKFEFADLTWYPSRHTAVYRYDNRASLTTRGDGVNDFIGFQPQSVLISSTVRASEKSFESTRNLNGKCTMATTTVGFKKLMANGLKSNHLLFTGYPVIGHQGKMQTSGSCLYSPSTRIDTTCAWDPRIKGLFFYESTAIFSAQNFRDFILDVKKLRDLNPQNFCNIDIYNGLLIRYIKASDAYLGQPENSVVVDFNYFRADDPMNPRLKEDILEEMEQMAFFKYNARPHWAKNRKLAFLEVQKKYPNFGKFIEAKRQLDPYNMFSSEWTAEILFGKDEVKNEGCGLEGLCVCSDDRHCNPSKGYFCRVGLVYEGARVCRYSPELFELVS